MPFLIWPAVTGFLMYALSHVVVKVLLTLGVFIMSMTGMEIVEGQIRSYLDGSLAGLPADAVQFVYLSGAFEGMSIIISAVVAKVALTATSKIGFKKPA